MYLAENLRYLRTRRGLSLSDIAELLGYKSLTTVSKWESGTNEPPFGIVKKLSDYYGVSMQTLATVDLAAGQPHHVLVELSPFENMLIKTYRNSDDVTQLMVCRSLGIDEEFEKRKSEQNFA